MLVKNGGLDSVVAKSWAGDVRSTLEGMISLSRGDQKALREMLCDLFDAETNEERGEVVVSIMELLAPGAPFSDDDSLSFDDWADGDTKTKGALARLSELKLQLGKKVERLMADRDWTQTDLAEELGVTQPTVSQVLSGRHKPQPKTLGRLAQVFGVSVQELWPE